MKIAIDVSPIATSALKGHKVRGVGKYIELLQENLPKFDKKNEYVFWNRQDSLPSDVTLVHYPYFELFAQSLPFIKSKKTVVTVHDLIPIKFKENFPAGLKGSINWQLQKYLLKQVDAIITDSESSKSDIISFTGIPLEKTHVVYLGIHDTFKFITQKKDLEQLRGKYHLPDEFVLYVGDITWNKNIPALVESIKKVNLTLVLVGKSIAEKDYDKTHPWNNDRARVHKMIEGDARFIPLGYVPEDDLIGIYNLANVFVMPSIYEGFGLPILEAMSCGCPVVTTQGGSIPEVGGTAVKYADPNDADDIGNAIGEVFFSSKLTNEYSQKGLEQSKKFSIEKMIKDTISVYEKFHS